MLEWEAFTELAQTDWSGDIRCVTRWSKFGMTWRGADARVLIERARPKVGAIWDSSLRHKDLISPLEV